MLAFLTSTAFAIDIDERGRVLVRSGGNAPTRFWFWQRGRFTELTGFNEPIMNARGQVAATILDAGGRHHPVIWTDGRLRDGGAFTDDIHVTDINVSVNFLNDRGDALGARYNRGYLVRGMLWRIR